MITRRAALAGAGALLVAAPAARSQVADDAALLRGALLLEQLSAAGYGGAAAADLLTEEVAGTAATIASHEQQHADVLAVHLEALGGPRPAPPADVAAADRLAAEMGLEDLTSALESQQAFLAWAEALELRTIAVLVDAVRRALDVGLTQTLISVLAAEGQHLAAVRTALGRPPVPRAFEPGG